ncbi:GNAT family protein [uncultured Maribacter sp.]|uniref:GNAT family N-acetyltransferase n=1 Tax=uncultured Maribacter sp. TaxID=431308 RepID=UPI00261B13DF|nr:GNAT family protein [uncultured Maribacter sp.]
MQHLKGSNIYLRALEMSDLDFLYTLENNTDLWEISGTITPYSKQVLRLYLENAYKDIYEVKQLRLCVCSANDAVIGLIDLFDFDPKNKRAGLGIVILNEEERNKGVGFDAVNVLCNYAFSTLGLHQIYANVLEDNLASIHLFKKIGFKEIGVKKDWVLSGGSFKNEILFQKINTCI